MDDELETWVGLLAGSLTRAGIEGTLTGAGVATRPAWSMALDFTPGLYALAGLRPRPGSQMADEWITAPDVLDQALTQSGRWLTEHVAAVMAFVGFEANIWVSGPIAEQLMAHDIHRRGRASASGYDQARDEVRSVWLGSKAALQFDDTSNALPWQDMVHDLKAALLRLPIEQVSIGMVTHRRWASLLYAGYGFQDGDPFHAYAYAQHPERWHEFALEPCGIQILTSQHLAAANDLSGWRTTRLDDDHFLVEARDLEPWYAARPKAHEPLEHAVLQQAYADFGHMILTPDRAAREHLDTKVDRNHPLR